jgi:opacity protein-like surface antigen
LRLSYASGPISAAVAVEDATGGGNYWGTYDALGVAAEIKYSGDSFNGEISAVWREGYNNSEDSYRVGAGVGFSLGDMASISIGAQMGSDVNDVDFWGASILASMNLSDTSHIEVAYGHKDYDEFDPFNNGFINYQDTDAVLVGLYYDPVDQLTIGLEGEWIHTSGGHVEDTDGLGDDGSVSSNDSMQIGIVTVFRF